MIQIIKKAFLECLFFIFLASQTHKTSNMKKNLLFFISILFIFSCISIKSTQKIVDRPGISYHSDEKDFLARWQKKWDKLYPKSSENEEAFKAQAKILVNKQMDVLSEYIKRGEESNSKIQAEYINNTLDYIKAKTPDISYLNSIPNLNNTFLGRAEILAKISMANIFSENRNFANWQSKWNELSPNRISEQYKLDAFIIQSNELLSKQITKVKDYISKGQEQDCEDENNSLKHNYNFVRSKYPNYDDDYNNITDLNDDYLSKVPYLVKMQRAYIYMDEKKYKNWQNKWTEIIPYTVSRQYIKVEFTNQSLILLQRQMDLLQNYIDRANESQTETTKNSLQDNYNYVRKKYPGFDNESNNIINLNDYYLESAVNLSKISSAKIFIRNHQFQKWIDKWSEIGEDITEQYLIDSFEVQSIRVFTTLYNGVTVAKENKNCPLWEEKSDLIVDILNQTYEVYPWFDNFRQSNPQLQNIKMDYLMRLNRDSKICIAENYLDNKNYDNWISKWTEIEFSEFLNGYEIDIFNSHCENVFKNLLNDIESAITGGYFSKTQELSNKTLDLTSQKVLTVNPNYIPTYDDQNEIYLYNAKFFAKAQNMYLSKMYKESIEFLLQNCNEKLSTPELKPKFTNFFTQNLEKLVELYEITITSGEDQKKVSDLNRMNDIYSLKPEYIDISYTPLYLNQDKKYSPFITWLNWQTDATIEKFFNEADSLMNQKLYTIAYDKIFKGANALPKSQEVQDRIDAYNYRFETEATDFYKAKINIKINKNSYLMAKNILDNDLMKVNPDFNTDRKNEYDQIVSNIKNKGTDYYILQRDRMIERQDWDKYCHKYCDSIEMINPTYDIDRCHDEIDFEKYYYEANNEYDNENYFCAIDIAEDLLKYNVEQNSKNKAKNLISDCEHEAVLTVNVSVDNSYLNDDLNSYINKRLQNYKNGYSYGNYLEVKSSGNADFTVDLKISNYDYEAEWGSSEIKKACIVDTRNEERTRVEKRKKTVDIAGSTYYIVSTSTGNIYKKGGNFYNYINGILTIVQAPLEYTYIEEDVTVKYTVKQYKYSQVSYKDKTGNEEMKFAAKLELKDNSGGYIKYSENKNFSQNNSYTKYEKSGSYDIKELVKCPSCTLNTWIDNSCSCGSFDEKPFNNQSDPFEGKNEFYDKYLENELHNYIKDQIPKMMHYIEKRHKEMKCD